MMQADVKVALEDLFDSVLNLSHAPRYSWRWLYHYGEKSSILIKELKAFELPYLKFGGDPWEYYNVHGDINPRAMPYLKVLAGTRAWEKLV